MASAPAQSVRQHAQVAVCFCKVLERNGQFKLALHQQLFCSRCETSFPLEFRKHLILEANTLVRLPHAHARSLKRRFGYGRRVLCQSASFHLVISGGFNG
jgi:hypothetical protein